MISENIEHRIEALSPKAKKLLLLKLKDAVTRNSGKTSANNRKRIVAYIQGNENFSVDDLKANLKKKLPDYMLPSEFVSVKSMPLLPIMWWPVLLDFYCTMEMLK